jgi:hypothetical protein
VPLASADAVRPELCARRWMRSHRRVCLHSHVHLHWDYSARPCSICIGTTALARASPAPGLGSPLPQLHGEWTRPSHIYTGDGTRLPNQPRPRPA